MTKNRAKTSKKPSKNPNMHVLTEDPESYKFKMIAIKITNPQMLDMVSEENPLHDPLLDMLMWGSDDTYLTRENARYLREVFTLLVALESWKPFEQRVIREQS